MQTIQLISSPFFIQRINNLILEDQSPSNVWDFQDDLNLTDHDIEALGENIFLTNYECYGPNGRVIYTINNTAVIDFSADTIFFVHDIFGNELSIEVGQSSPTIDMETLIDNYQRKTLKKAPNEEPLIIEMSCDVLKTIPKGKNLEYLQELFSEMFYADKALPDGVIIKSVSELLDELNHFDPEFYFKPVIKK